MAFTGFESIAALSNLVTNKFQLDFAKYIQGDAGKFNTLTNEITTNTENADIPFINRWDQLEGLELHESPRYSTVVGEYITRAIKRYAKGVEISKFTWSEPISQSLLKTRLEALVAEAAYLRSRRMTFNLTNGDSTVLAPYDEVAPTTTTLFSNTHTLNGQTFDNLLAGNALDYTGYNAAREVLRRIPLGKDGTFLPTEAAQFFLVVPTNLEETAYQLMNGDYRVESGAWSGAKNNWKGSATTIVSSLLTDNNDWYLIMTLPGLTPFATVKHTTSSPTLKAHIAETDPNVIKNNLYQWELQIVEETYPIHYYMMVKSTQS